MPELPTGTVTFLFTDPEGSKRLREDHPETMRRALARHDAIVLTTRLSEDLDNEVEVVLID